MGLFYGSGFFGYPSSGTPGVPVDTVFDPIGDFELIADGQEAVTLIDRDGNEFSREHSLRREIKRQEVFRSNGYYQQGDSVFNLSTTEQQIEPGLGWIVRTDDFGDFTILGVQRQTLGDRWRCVARNLDVTYRLENLVEILKKDKVRSASGAFEVQWVATQIEVRARIQAQEARRVVENGRTVYPERALCVLKTQQAIDGSNLIRDHLGRIWKVVQMSNKDRIDVLFELELERTAWPMS